jgi:TonB-dependent receptor
MKQLLLLATLVLFSLASFAQTGIIRGVIRDGKTHDVIIGATVQVMGLPTPMGISTDVNGQFELPKVPAGTHTIQISYVSYKTKTIQAVRVESGNATVLESDLAEDNQQLQEVVVKAGRTTNTEVAVVAEIKQIKAMAVGISAMQIQKSQDRDAAAAIRRVPGVSIVDNRFVLIRGLGARYNSVLINDVIAPSTEVETRSFSFDIIPSNILDRMIIYKSGTADLPGDFGGGVIKIYTKRRPDQNFTDVGLTIGYRPGTTGQSVQTHERDGLNALGLWGRDQQIPTSFPARSADFNNLNAPQRAAYARLLPNTWALQTVSPMPDIRFALNTGRRFDVGDVRISNLTSINYSMSHQFADIDFRLYNNGLNANELDQQYTDANYNRNTRLGLLHNWSFRFSPTFNLEWKTLVNQLSTTETLVRNGRLISDEFDNISYSQRFENRTIATTQVLGEHNLDELTKLNWIAGFGYSGRWEPDWKRARYQRVTNSNQPFELVTPVDPNPIDVGRFYSQLNEQTYTLASNYERVLGTPTDREPSRIKAGIYGERRNRDYAARFYGYNAAPGTVEGNRVTQQSIGSIFSPENVSGRPGGLTLRDGTRDLDSYRGYNTYAAGYVSADLNLTPRLNVTAGFRGEYNVQELRSMNTATNVDRQLVNRPIFSPLPSLNIAYKLTDLHSVRLAYSATVNRPELRELAPFSYFDFNLLADVRGNRDLTTANIQNVDAKWEFYPSSSELITVTGFYKYFTNPIETFLLPTGNGFAYTFVNARSARNLGVEVELRKGFERSSSLFLKNVQFVGNASIINSRINLGETVRVPGLDNEPQDISLAGLTDRERPLANQSPYLINAGIYYTAPKSGFQWNVLYNVYGQRIFAVGNTNNPTIYEMPRNVVDLNISKTFSSGLELRLGIQDLLNQPFRLSQDFNRDGGIGSDVTTRSPNADQDIRSFRRGQYVTLTAVYSFKRRTIVP